MNTRIDVDADLLAQAVEISGLPSEKAAVEEALRRFVEARRCRSALEALAGLGWDGDLDAMRESRLPFSAL